MFEQVTKKESRFRIFWPEVDDLYGAEEAIKLARWACFLTAGLTAVLAAVGMLPRTSLVDAGVFAVLGYGVVRRWRAAAVAAFLLFTANLIYTVTQGGGIGVLAIFIFVGLLNGVRGTFAHKSLGNSRPEASGQPSVDPAS